jgi:two-component sensor histidine kinase
MSAIQPPGPVHLLYIDDDTAFARLTERALTRQGFAVTHAPSGDEGLALLQSGHFDAVALDHVMPGRSGPETLAEIVARPEAPPVVYVTAADAGRVAVEALKAGASDFMLKDLGESFFDLLGETIRQAIGALQAERERASALAEMAAQRDRAEALLREVNHRVANSLALVASFAHLQASGMAEGEGRDAVLDLQRRVVAVGQVHRRLYTSGDVRSVDLAGYLQGLVDELALSMADDGRVSEIHFVAEPVELPTDRAIALGVIVSELITNALKYAYRDRQPGPIRVGLARIAPGLAEVSVVDEGVGLAGAGCGGSGLGSRILAAMARTLRAELHYPEVTLGTDVRVRFANPG